LVDFLAERLPEATTVIHQQCMKRPLDAWEAPVQPAQ
jgi:hypothetical protein